MMCPPRKIPGSASVCERELRAVFDIKVWVLEVSVLVISLKRLIQCDLGRGSSCSMFPKKYAVVV